MVCPCLSSPKVGCANFDVPMHSPVRLFRVVVSASCKGILQISGSLSRAFGLKKVCGRCGRLGRCHRAAPKRGRLGMNTAPATRHDDTDEDESCCTFTQHENGYMDESLWSELPTDLLERVLAFLPPPAFFRFRAVCKKWDKIMYNSNFLKLCSEISAQRPWFVMFQTGPCDVVSAYNPSLSKWHRFSLSFLPTRVQGVAAAGGLLCCKGEVDGYRSLFVCNPITKTWRRLPPMRKKRIVPIVGLVVDRSTKAYKVIAAGDDLMSDGFNVRDLTTEVYDSATNSWELSGGIPPRSDLDLGVTLCQGFLYFVTYCPYGVLSYSIKQGVWKKIDASTPRYLTTPSLVECRGRLLMVGGVERKNVVRSIRIWELQRDTDREKLLADEELLVRKCQDSSKEGSRSGNVAVQKPAALPCPEGSEISPDASLMKWVEIARMPHKIRKDFFKKSSDRYFSSVGHGDLICLTIYESPEVLVYDVSKRAWSWLPRYPSEDFEEHLWGFPFDPRLDAVV